MEIQSVKFKYLNHRGEVRERTVTPDSIEFVRDPGFDYQPGWFLSGYDHDKRARRSFALSRIIIEMKGKSPSFMISLCDKRGSAGADRCDTGIEGRQGHRDYRGSTPSALICSRLEELIGRGSGQGVPTPGETG